MFPSASTVPHSRREINCKSAFRDSFFQRLRQHTAIDSENLKMYKDLREEFPEIAACVEKIAEHIEKTWSCTLSEEEKLYLILHVNRILAKEGL